MSGIFSSGGAPATNKQDYVQKKAADGQRGELVILITFLDSPFLLFGACFVNAVKPGDICIKKKTQDSDSIVVHVNMFLVRPVHNLPCSQLASAFMSKLYNYPP